MAYLMFTYMFIGCLTYYDVKCVRAGTQSVTYLVVKSKDSGVRHPGSSSDSTIY